MRKRWIVLSVLVLLLMALPQSVCLADIGILNGDFTLWADNNPVGWVRDAASPGTLYEATDKYHTAPPSASLSGEEDTQPVALSGRVWVYCDAADKAIEPGDMLTTAARAGHAMAVTDFSQAHGAVLGKAMSKLAKGETGLVLALVNLQ